MAKDPVPNIRFNYAKTVEQFYRRLSNSNKMDCSDNLRSMANNDADADVKFFAGKSLAVISGENN